jgi:hypothetical protein
VRESEATTAAIKTQLDAVMVSIRTLEMTTMDTEEGKALLEQFRSAGGNLWKGRCNQEIDDHHNDGCSESSAIDRTEYRPILEQ